MELSNLWSPRVDRVLARLVSPASVTGYVTASRLLPSFRFPDLFNAIETLCRDRAGVSRVASENGEDLNSLLHAKQPHWESRKVTQPTRLPWPLDPEKEVFLPADHFWVIPQDGSGDRIVVRLKYRQPFAATTLEASSPELASAEALMTAILDLSVRDSVYRNQTLQVSFESATKDEYGDVEKPQQLRVTFKRVEPVSDDDLIVEPRLRDTLLRNVVDLHVRREILKQHRVPIRRGVLLYGPPGTGKTYACRYLCGKLEDATRILVTGSALLHVGQVFQLARLLQPSVLFLEDVDLVFMSREVNLYSSVLGDLLDHMDGLRPFEDVGFVLTTNAIDRMEAAVKDRPGRISQCIHFGPPAPELRERYLVHYLRHYDVGEVDIPQLVRDSQGATQAFLKEWIHRAVQVATERITETAPALGIRTADFQEALREMRSSADGSTGSILGLYL